MQFAFKTTSTEGLLLLYTGSESSAALQSLELVDGKLIFRLNFGPDGTVMISRERYNDGNWHDLEAKRTSEHLYLTLDGVLGEKSWICCFKHYFIFSFTYFQLALKYLGTLLFGVSLMNHA